MTLVPDSVQLEQYRQRARQAPNDPDAAFNQGWAAAKAGLWQEALTAYERALDLGVTSPEEVHTNMASIYSEHLGNPDSALRCLSRALALNPNYFPAVFNRAHLAEQLGARTDALDGFNAASVLDPQNPMPVARAADACPPTALDDALLQRLRHFAEAGDVDALLALAKVEEANGAFNAAWRAMTRANAIDGQGRKPWPLEPLSQYHHQRINSGLPSLAGAPGPVFIAGMFRTGSTLLEQMLSAHHSFVPLGESEFWPRQVAAHGGGMVVPANRPVAESALETIPKAFLAHLDERGISQGHRVTDKRPDNVYHIGLIGRLLPNARFVITERDWRDTLVSVWGTRLHPQHGYASDLAMIRQQIVLCRSLAAHWEQRYPERVRRLSYEELVAAPEATLRDLLQWLGEPWDPNCLQFHTLRNPVRTASVWQVREPLHTGRQGRWRHYEQELRAVFGASLDQSDPAA